MIKLLLLFQTSSLIRSSSSSSLIIIIKLLLLFLVLNNNINNDYQQTITTSKLTTLFASSFNMNNYHRSHYHHYNRNMFYQSNNNYYERRLNLIPLSSIADYDSNIEKKNYTDNNNNNNNVDITFLTKQTDDYRLCFDSNGNYIRNNHNENDTNNNSNNNSNENNPCTYTLCIVQEEDLPLITNLQLHSFGTEAITLSSDFSQFESMLLKPTLGLWNNYANVIAYMDVLSGLKNRIVRKKNNDVNNVEQWKELIKLPNQIKSDNDDGEAIVSQSSLILALAKLPHTSQLQQSQQPFSFHYDDSIDSDQSLNIIASVEIRLQPTDAKIPLTQPWLDKIERQLDTLLSSSTNNNTIQPYLSNLCVHESFRGQKIGQGLCRLVESIIRDIWTNYNTIYLHVDYDNVAALKLYQREGYLDVNQKWTNPLEIIYGSSTNGDGSNEDDKDIGYFVKVLKE